MSIRSYAVLAAPSTLGLAADGVEELPEQLLKNGLADRIRACSAGRLTVPSKQTAIESETRVLNAHEIAEWSPTLANAVEELLNKREFPIILGGDCTIVLGSMLALRRRGRYGLLFIDGNADFFQPEAEPNGEGASMDLAFVTGHGPAVLTQFEGYCPLVRDEDVVAFGFRDHEDQAEFGSQPLPAQLRTYDLPAIRQMGIEAAATAAVEHLTRAELDGFFIHIDADCLDDSIMPAVDFRLAGGLSWSELATVLRTALASDEAVGLEVAIYNPRLDPDGRAGRGLTDVLVSALKAVDDPQAY